MIDNANTKLLEHLPTEIFLRIFASLQFEDIIKAFSGLNSRFNSIIQCINDGNFQVSYNDDQNVRLIHSYPNQICRLILTHSPNVNFVSGANLRSLTIRYGTLAQLNAIRPGYFPELEILHICGVNGPSVIDKAKAINDLFEIILSNNGFTRLRICTAVGIEPLDLNENWTESSSIHHLILDGQTSVVYEKLNVLCSNLRKTKVVAPISIDAQIDAMQTNPLIVSAQHRRRITRDIMATRQLESEKKFTLDYCEQKEAIVLGGRLFPKIDPYYCGSFRIEIKLPTEYPFKPPDGYFLDPIYHPMVGDSGRHCCCWNLSSSEWTPARTIVDYIIGMINIIDHPDLWNNHGDCIRYSEYFNNHSDFYEKALQSVFQYGKSRF